MEPYPISLALFDLLPITAFLIGAIFLVKTARLGSGKRAGWMMLSGGLLVFLGGFTKALWKLLLAAQIADIVWLGEAQFVLSGLGLLLMCLTMLSMLRQPSTLAKGGVVLSMALWKIPFLAIMLISGLGLDGMLSYVAFRRGLKLAGTAFALGLIGLLAMGAFSGAEQTISTHWVAETVNTFGQSAFMLGNILLYRDVQKRGGILPVKEN